MTEHEKLQQAYRDLGINGGDGRDVIKRWHKRLIMVWHPDRFPIKEGKEEAEEELKKINNATDLLMAHFDKAHTDSLQCPCRSGANGGPGQQTSGTGAGPGPDKRRTTQENDREEAEARKPSEERKRQADADAANAKRAREETAAAMAEAAARRAAAENAITQQKRLQDESLRWKVAMALGVVWIGLTLYAWLGVSLKDWWHDFSWKWERDHSPAPAAPQNVRESSTPGSQPYIPPYNKFPGGNNEDWLQQQKLDQQRRDEDVAKQKKQDIYDTRAAIDRCQKTIAHCQSEIAKVEAQLADPSVSDYEKRKASSFGDAQRGYLSQAQANLAEAQKRFTKLTGQPASEANMRTWGPDSPDTITPTPTPGKAPGTLLDDLNLSVPVPKPVENTNTTQP